MLKKEVILFPKNENIQAVITNITKTKWSDLIKKENLSKFPNPDEQILVIDYEILFNDKIIKGKDQIKFYDTPSSRSKLGMFLLKYDILEVGMKIYVNFDQLSKMTILLL